MLAASAWLLRRLEPFRHGHPEWLAAIVLSAPALTTIATGQSSALILLCVVGAATLWTRGQVVRACALLGLLAIKPNWGIVFGIMAIVRREWTGAAAMAGVAALLCLLTVPLGLQLWADFLGRYPDVIFEFLSPSTRQTDRTTKKELYERVFRTQEYYWYDPFNPRELQGWRWHSEDGYQAMVPDERGWLWSPSLQLWIGRWEGTYKRAQATWLRFYDQAGRLALTSDEAAAQHAEAERTRAEAERTRAEAERTRADTLHDYVGRARRPVLEILDQARRLAVDVIHAPGDRAVGIERRAERRWRRRFGLPEEVAAAVVFLVSERAAYVTGSTIHVNGGMLMRPYVVSRIVTGKLRLEMRPVDVRAHDPDGRSIAEAPQARCFGAQRPQDLVPQPACRLDIGSADHDLLGAVRPREGALVRAASGCDGGYDAALMPPSGSSAAPTSSAVALHRIEVRPKPGRADPRGASASP